MEKKPPNTRFQQDYYWMMGDNRHRSEDSRYCGFVPEDHIVGKPVLIWFSIEGINDGIRNWRIRWDRVMTTVKGEGKAFAFGPYVFGIIVIWQIIAFILEEKKHIRYNAIYSSLFPFYSIHRSFNKGQRG